MAHSTSALEVVAATWEEVVESAAAARASKAERARMLSFMMMDYGWMRCDQEGGAVTSVSHKAKDGGGGRKKSGMQR